MPSIIKEARLVCADIGANNNKFINIFLYDNGDVEVEYGRIGITSTKEIVTGKGEKTFDKKVADKKKGKSGPGGVRHSVYTESRTVAAGTKTIVQPVTGSLHEIASKQIVSSDPIVAKLVERLVRENVHAITSSTNVSFNASTGQFQTPLGIVTPEGIADARKDLAIINQFITAGDWRANALVEATNRFLRTVPQNVGMRLNLQTLFPNNNAVQQQLDFLDGMEAVSSTPAQQGTVKHEKVFDVRMSVASPAELERVRQLYQKSRKDMHVCAHLGVKIVYELHIASMSAAFELGKKVGNLCEYWHGTRKANVLSILKSGLKKSPPSTAAIAGKLFGNGIYFSDQSTKSLNYAYGYWSGSRDDSCMMFLAHVAMGKFYTPTGYGNRYSGNTGYPVKGYDSTFAKGGESGVANNEMIVYEDNRCNLIRLVEFSPGGK